jgi:DNA-binding NarL/FixJ family response regulator
VDALRVRAAAAIDLVAQGLLDSEAALTLVVWPTDKVLIASEACADQDGRNAYTEGQRERALELVDSGLSWAQAGREVGVSKSTVGTWVRKRQRPA